MSTTLQAQTPTGRITGHVADSAGAPLAASLRVLGPGAHGAYADASGQFLIADVPAGPVKVEVRYPGFTTDTFGVTVVGGQAVDHAVVLHGANRQLAVVRVTAAGVAETQAYALETQKRADNIVSVISGDEIRSLPNYNAAEAAERLPGVAAEEDEGEGKYVQIRGTPPDFQHVTIDGADVPGTLATDVRAVKLDDVPAELLGSVEVSKTLTADQDASAIGGSVNLVSKVPEGAPHGYVAATYGYQSQESNNDGQGSFTYGGRVNDQKLGFLLSGSYDRIDRTLNDVEPSFTGVASTPGGGPGSFYAVPYGPGYSHIFPSSWSEREYNYYRTRYGLGGDLDYRFSPTTSISVKGLWSAFFDQANRWETNVSGGNGNGGDSIINGIPTVPGGGVKNTVSNRGPTEHTWGFVSQATHQAGPVHFNFSVNYAGSEATTHDHLEDTYKFSQNGFNYGYNGSNLNPAYIVPNSVRSAIASPTNWHLTEVDTDNELNSGQDIGAKMDALIPYSIASLPASFKFGLKYRNEHKGYLDFEPQYQDTSSTNQLMSQFLSSYNNPNFYQHLCANCYTLAPYGSIPSVQTFFHANPGNFAGISGQTEADNLNSFAGTEQVAAIYGMQTLDVGQMHINAGLRLENSTVGYVGHITTGPNDTLAGTVQHGGHTYLDFFPSLQLRYALDENTNLRVALTRGIARPDYVQLAPFVNGVGVSEGPQTPITEGNPALKPEYAWNYDLLAEHFFPSVGVISGGFFYKDIHDFIFQRLSPYTGTNPNFLNAGGTPFYVSQYQNGPSAELWGIEADYTQHLTFLPSALAGIGFDVNWTHVESRAVVPIDTTVTYTYTLPNGNQSAPIQPYHSAVRHAALDRTIPNMFNLALLYDWSTVSFRVAGQYTAATINAYGLDGSSNPESSDNYFYPHWQVDAELTWRVYGNTALTVSGQNINNEYFGFFTGTPGNRQNNQRETYGSVWAVGVRQGF
ncbi:MAG TPA: TonB-dependent receptor [Gemmatimonadaceae bacterium]|nr:TonB-dependent receptor [Gemmatimonadaceae bacterium]